MLSAISVYAQSGSCGTALIWNYADGVLTISGTGEMSIDGTASYDIYKDRIKSVVVGDGVTTIDDGAFKGYASLESVKLPSTLTSINQDAFNGCAALKKIDLPESLREIGQRAFKQCDLHGLTVPRGVIEVEADAFDSNPYLEVVIWNCDIPRDTYVENILYSYQRSFFKNSGVRKVVFGPEVTEIPDNLFIGTSLNELESQGTIEYVGLNAFKDTPWMTSRSTLPIYIDKCLYHWPNEINGPVKIEVREGTKGIAPCVFADMSNITEVTLPVSLEYMGTCVFAKCSSLTKINYNSANLSAVTHNYYDNNYHKILGPALAELVVGPDVKSLPEALCENQGGLKEVILPGVTNIGANCFRNCAGLVKVRMDKVVNIDDYAFDGTAIQSLSLPNTLEHIGYSAFADIPDQQQIVFGPNLKSIGQNVFRGITIENMQINTSLPDVEPGKGYLAAQVNHLIIGDDVKVMPTKILLNGTISGGNYVCKTLTVGRSVQCKPRNSSAYAADTVYWNAESAITPNISNNGRYYVTDCRKLIVGDGVKTLPDHMISAHELEEVSLPEGLETIGDYVFDHAKFKSLALPKSLKEIGEGTFRYCHNLESVTVEWEDPRLVNVAANAFSDKNPEAVLFVPKGTEKLYASIDPWKQFVNIGSDPDTWEKPQCDAPIVTFADGRLNFTCDTEDATYHYSITDSDIKSGESKDGNVALSASYEISAYSEAPGHINSDITRVTLCFLSEGASSDVADIAADRRGVAICVHGHDIVVSGLDENEEVVLCDISGRTLASGNAVDGKAYFHNVEVSSGVVIVRFNGDSVKVAI